MKKNRVGVFLMIVCLWVQGINVGGRCCNMYLHESLLFLWNNLGWVKYRLGIHKTFLSSLFWLFLGPTLGFDTKQRNSFLVKFGVFYNQNKILTILFIVDYEKITL